MSFWDLFRGKMPDKRGKEDRFYTDKIREKMDNPVICAECRWYEKDGIMTGENGAYVPTRSGAKQDDFFKSKYDWCKRPRINEITGERFVPMVKCINERDGLCGCGRYGEYWEPKK